MVSDSSYVSNKREFALFKGKFNKLNSFGTLVYSHLFAIKEQFALEAFGGVIVNFELFQFKDLQLYKVMPKYKKKVFWLHIILNVVKVFCLKNKIDFFYYNCIKL